MQACIYAVGGLAWLFWCLWTREAVLGTVFKGCGGHTIEYRRQNNLLL